MYMTFLALYSWKFFRKTIGGLVRFQNLRNFIVEMVVTAVHLNYPQFLKKVLHLETDPLTLLQIIKSKSTQLSILYFKFY